MALRYDEYRRKFSSKMLLAHYRLFCSMREEKRQSSRPRSLSCFADQCGGRNAAVETFIPSAVQNILGVLRELEPTIITYLKEKQEQSEIKWHVNVHCEFKKPKKHVTGALTDDFDTEFYQASKTYDQESGGHRRRNS